MKIAYFSDTDTLLVVFNERTVIETHDVNENVFIDLAENGFVASMTIEHAKQQTNLGEFSYQLDLE